MISLRLFNAGTTSFLFLVWKRMSTRCRLLREVSLLSKALVNGAMLMFHLLVFHISLFFFLYFKIQWAFFLIYLFLLIIIIFSLLLFFYNMILTLTTLRFLARDSLHTLRYTTYSILKIQLAFMLLTLFYLHYVQCDNAQIFRGTSFTHTRSKQWLTKISSFSPAKT